MNEKQVWRSGKAYPVAPDYKTPIEAQVGPDWEGGFAYIRIKQNHIALFEDGWAISFMSSRKIWKRGFRSLSSAKKSLTAAYKRLAKIEATHLSNFATTTATLPTKPNQ